MHTDNKYILGGKDGHEAILTYDLFAWAEWFENSREERIVKQTTKKTGVRVSTVFLSLDHNFSGAGGPLLFETMVFGGSNDGYQERCTTWEQAVAQHERIVRFHSYNHSLPK